MLFVMWKTKDLLISSNFGRKLKQSTTSMLTNKFSKNKKLKEKKTYNLCFLSKSIITRKFLKQSLQSFAKCQLFSYCKEFSIFYFRLVGVQNAKKSPAIPSFLTLTLSLLLKKQPAKSLRQEQIFLSATHLPTVKIQSVTLIQVPSSENRLTM